MDPLSRVIELLTVQSAVSSRLEAGGTWALSFPGVRHVKFGAVHRGEAWLRVGPDGVEQHLVAGDCFVLTTGTGYAVASAPGLEPVDGLPVFGEAVDGRARVGTGEDVVLTGGRFVFDDRSARLLLDVLPPLVVVAGDGEHAAPLRAALDLFAHETAGRRLGASLLTELLGQVVFVEALRAAADAEDGRVHGWLAALADDRIGTVLRLMHEDPARRWTVPELARTATMSRSAFAVRFRTLVGAPPLDHLLRLRMHAAGRDLQRGTATVSAVGAAWGYGSDAAFSNAFKRVMGTSPSAWRAQGTPGPALLDVTDAARHTDAVRTLRT
ncbi:AraC family transcriptional regulator [Modestobacter sp. VKM Ac-2978]|uniref:AraC family transcriptional regulator n=1 Tax=Modestobacter sp. VKM Ac-2978 TaxID=3004132 RepID=UPI0022AA2B7C|nr:AraC family transcriptional regulator [Modestobacter sp. VKM Ac-2978]MCZ2846922.1 AraC family transcriptional regulator [Modestobacter sp. VKM Ac-2978]